MQQLYTQALRLAFLARFLDEKMAKNSKQSKGGSFHISSQGHELVGIMAALALAPYQDWALPYYRDRPFVLAWGVSLKELLAAGMAKVTGHHSNGRMMPDHFSDRSLRIVCQSSCVASQFLHAVGVAKGIALRQLPEIVYVSGGDGSTSEGDFHETLNFSCLHKLPLMIVIQDNGWAISVPAKEQTAGGSIADMISGYAGLCVELVDGADFEALASAFNRAVMHTRAGKGPVVVVAKVKRLLPHSSSDDDKKYKSEEERALDRLHDPLPALMQYGVDRGWISPDQLSLLKTSCFEEVEEASIAAEGLMEPVIEAEPSLFHPYLNSQSASGCETVSTDPVVMVDALNHALGEAMDRDVAVVLFGEDVAGEKGGVFGVTKNLTNRFGVNRCFNTPIAESTIVGIALGLSCAGFVPVAEIQFADYLWPACNQLFNELASIYYRSNGEWNCPVVLRMPCGGYIQGGPYHSQSIEGFLAHCPGLKIVMPSHAADAKRLLIDAIADPNPVIFLEHKALYRQRHFCARQEPLNIAASVLGVADVVLAGNDLTVISWGFLLVKSVQLAKKLQLEGFSIEVIDLRTLVPFDRQLIITSVKKTGKVLIAQEGSVFCGLAAEIAAVISHECFYDLDAPVTRLGAKHAPVPYNLTLERATLPQDEDLERAVVALLAY